MINFQESIDSLCTASRLMRYKVDIIDDYSIIVKNKTKCMIKLDGDNLKVSISNMTSTPIEFCYRENDDYFIKVEILSMVEDFVYKD